MAKANFGLSPSLTSEALTYVCHSERSRRRSRRISIESKTCHPLDTIYLCLCNNHIFQYYHRINFLSFKWNFCDFCIKQNTILVLMRFFCTIDVNIFFVLKTFPRHKKSARFRLESCGFVIVFLLKLTPCLRCQRVPSSP